MAMREKPKLRRIVQETIPDDPEALFVSLSGRSSSHGYLRGPQQDVLRAYAEAASTDPDLALELPTGTGKTAVGLLIAEWRRRKHNARAAYLAITNQLAQQVIAEARKLGIKTADLTGTREQRSAAEEGRYMNGQAVAVSSYSNLFNVNPVIREFDVIVFDDAHGGGQFCATNWTVRISRTEDPDLYDELFAALAPSLQPTQLDVLLMTA